MAKKLLPSDIPTGPQFIRWATTKAEDFLLIDAIQRIEKFVMASDHQWNTLIVNYFDRGLPISDRHLMILNQHLRRKNMETVPLEEGHSDSYTTMRGPEKSEQRAVIREALENFSPAEREIVLTEQRRLVDLQPGRDLVADAMRAARNYQQEPEDDDTMASQLSEQLSKITAVKPSDLRHRRGSKAAAPTVSPAKPAAPKPPEPEIVSDPKTGTALALIPQENNVLDNDPGNMSVEEIERLLEEKSRPKGLTREEVEGMILTRDQIEEMIRASLEDDEGPKFVTAEDYMKLEADFQVIRAEAKAVQAEVAALKRIIHKYVIAA